VAQADHFGPAFIWIAIPLLSVVLFAGAATASRLSTLNREAIPIVRHPPASRVDESDTKSRVVCHHREIPARPTAMEMKPSYGRRSRAVASPNRASSATRLLWKLGRIRTWLFNRASAFIK
jgi:hypothetical protein